MLVYQRSFYLILLATLAIGHVYEDDWGEQVKDDARGGDHGDAQFAAASYLDSLIEKHGTRLQKEIEHFNHDFENARWPKTDGANCDSKEEWHVGDVSLTVLDKDAFSTMLNKVEKGWRLPLKLLGRLHLPDLGLYFLSIGDTDIFEQL